MNIRQSTAFIRLTVRLTATLAAAVALNGPDLRASPIVFEGWDQAGDVSGWVNTIPGGATLANNAQYLSISFAEATVPLPNQDDIIRTGPGAAGGFTGDYVAAGIQSISFQFLALDYQPDSLALYFASSSRVWSLALEMPALAVWTDYSASLDYAAGWAGGPGADAAAFTLDLTTVDWVGVYIGRTYAGCDVPPAQRYGLDAFASRMEVPEPETYLLIMATLFPLLIVFRRELVTTLARASQRIT
jgi:hypothetical protein